MEYIFYTLGVVALLGTLAILARQPGEDRLKRRQALLAERGAERGAERAAKRARLRRQASKPSRQGAVGRQQRSSALVRELKQVATPWGWPGSEVRFGNGLNGVANGQAMNGAQRWIDRLVAEKRTVEDSDYIQRRTDSLRAMVEDRFGRSAKHSEIAFRPVRPPLLRDPNRPHDQMDNFPSGRTDRIVAKLQPQPRTTAELRNSAKARANVPLRDVKTPWGW